MGRLLAVGVTVAGCAGLALWLRRRRDYTRRAPDSEDGQRGVVGDAYTAVAKGEQSCCVSVKKGEVMGYTAADRALGSASGADLGLGCGNPVELANLVEGEIVVDLGCGAGIDCLLAASRVGERGRAIGVDMVPEMLKRAKEAARRVGMLGVTDFRLGEIEHLPIADGVADAVLSNCVLNLCANKVQVLREACRVLRPGGRLAFSDVVQTQGHIPERLKSEAALACWVSGAPPPDELTLALQAAGFEAIAVVPKPSSRAFIKEWLPGSGAEDYVVSANVTATKPGGAARPPAAAAAPEAAAAWAESEGEEMPARMRAKLAEQAQSKQCWN